MEILLAGAMLLLCVAGFIILFKSIDWFDQLIQ